MVPKSSSSFRVGRDGPVHTPVQNDGQIQKYEMEIVWKNVAIYVILHLVAAHAIWVLTARTMVYVYCSTLFLTWGVGAGAHRLWAHRAYEAKLPLRILLMILQTTSLQNHIYEWSRDHRVHHKFTETDADPHNAKRGFVFSHFGWLLVRKHKDVIIKGRTVDMSDLEKDPVVMFQKKYYTLLISIFCIILPSLMYRYCWDETWWNSIVYCNVLRYVLSLNWTWLVNSAAHMFGTRPYDVNMHARENKMVSVLTCGEGWHNYHHVFPWDYKAAELGNSSVFNSTTAVIALMAKIGWAYNLKTVSPEMIKRRAERTGDGTWKDKDNRLWGWGDQDMSTQDADDIKFYNKLC